MDYNGYIALGNPLLQERREDNWFERAREEQRRMEARRAEMARQREEQFRREAYLFRMNGPYRHLHGL